MSVIVAVIKKNKIAIGADSQFNAGSLKKSSKYVVSSDKIIRVGSSYIGLTGWGATCLVAEHLFLKHKDKLNFKDRFSIFESLLNIHELLKEDYFIETNDDIDDQPVESNQIDGLIINENGIFSITNYRQVIEYGKFWAIGSGRSYALGAMFGCYDQFDDPKKIAEIGVPAACEFDDGCGLPSKIYGKSLDKK